MAIQSNYEKSVSSQPYSLVCKSVSAADGLDILWSMNTGACSSAFNLPK